MKIYDKRPIIIKVGGSLHEALDTSITLSNTRTIQVDSNGFGAYVVLDPSTPVVVTKTKSSGAYTHSMSLYKIDGAEWGVPSTNDTEEHTVTMTIPAEFFTAAHFLEVYCGEQE